MNRADSRICLTGLHGSAPAFALTLLAQAQVSSPTAPRPSVVLAADDTAAERLFNDLRFFHTLLGLPSDNLAWFPEWETLPYEATAPHIGLIARRMTTLHHLCANRSVLVVASMRAAMHRLVPRRIFEQTILRFKSGEIHERESLLAALLRLGYRRVSVVDIPGEFSVRGGIIDIFSTAYTDPLRLEMLGDQIESIRLFDASTQTSIKTISEGLVLPAREFIRPADAPDALAPISPDAEWRSPEIYPQMDSLFHYLTGEPRLVLNQPQSLERACKEAWTSIDDGYLRHVDRDAMRPYPSPETLFLTWEDIRQETATWPLLAMEPLAAAETAWDSVVSFTTQAPAAAGLGVRGTPFSQTLVLLERLRANHLIVLVARSRGQVDRLLALFREHDLPADEWRPAFWSNQSDGRLPFLVMQGELSSGFLSSELRLAVLTEEELFAKGARHKPQQKSKAATFLSSLDDLNVGDYVVHIQHGIAKYRGLKRLAVQDFESDYLALEFAGSDILYVPLDRLNQIQRYSGAENHVPRLNRLGGTTWAKTTARVKKDIEEMAHELIELYASREVVKRPSYGSASTFFHEFEAAFEYEETPDQLKAIEDIFRDMEATKPMDRLVCGDVGYGKTEVAMRAAFKAVEHGRQVAVLVPTTLLAHQHYDTFAERFAPFPVRVALLSRFQSPRESKAILADLAAGVIDIIIGTHRLLQKQVVFRNLGLVIIDEEQWFGVKHKERLKQLRTQVDVLTLTATPIPRTLQMAMSGVRDLSVIETPPVGRLAIKTEVVRASNTIVRDAILRELGRGGQVYFIHNRVETMESTATWLRQLVPEARLVMAHGQMNAKPLEAVMLKFLRGEADVLLASAIVQSGLDVPNANTIIVNRADTFGLAQLYQLRGRVGRSGQQAFAYFLIPDEGTLTSEAQKRLIAIQQFTELGSGFRIAAADLEIRGAGNLLGKQQSGHIAAVGLDLYMQMVEQAVRRLKGQVMEEEPDPTLQLPVSAFIPEDFVADPHQRLSLYKRLSACNRIGDLALLHGEIHDRYGLPPEPVERLLEVMQLRIHAKSLRMVSLEVRGRSAVLTWGPHASVSDGAIGRLMDRFPKRLRFLSPRSVEIHLSGEDWPVVYTELNAALQSLSLCDTTSPETGQLIHAHVLPH
ncbi:MAG: transcription-repair coupling factor [Nitrospira sp.]|nr:transcription-repair coupling factor [Nitrospira sp.]